MRADRLLAILLVMQNKERVTAAELAAQLEVSHRTIYRDMDALTTAGIPVVAERGNKGGWYLLEGYRANLNALNVKELQTLFLSQPLFADLGLAQAAKNALLKMVATLPVDYQAQVEVVNQRLYIDPTGWQRAKDDVSWLTTLQTAVWNAMQLELRYRRADNSIIDRLVEPLGLVAKGGIWYLVAATDGNMRTYRVSRVLTATVTDQACQRPENFDLKTYWHQSMTEHMDNITHYPVRLRVSPDMLSHILDSGTYFKIDQSFSANADEWSHLQIHFGTPDEAREFVLGLGTSVEVIEPETLRHELVEMAQAVIDHYASRPANL